MSSPEGSPGAAMHPEDWLSFVEREYLDTFIRDGGAAVKYPVALDDSTFLEVRDELTRRARDLGYITVNIDAAHTKVHLIEEVFFRVAEAIPWRELAERVVIKLALELNYREPDPGDESLLVRIGVSNHLDDSASVHREIRAKVEKRVSIERRLAKDFRIAMSFLCLHALAGGPASETASTTLVNWLTGRVRPIGPMKLFQICARINRANARFMLQSALRWTRFAGLPGVVVLLDVRRLSVPKNPKDGLLFYSASAFLDAAELQRQLIDETDRMEGCLVVVLPDSRFHLPEEDKRGLRKYDALYLRVAEEISDRTLVNPLASMVRLSTGARRVEV